MFDEISTTCSIAEISLHVHPPPTTHICMLICAHTFMLLPKFNFSHCCRLVYTARPHAPRSEKVVGIGFQPGFDPYKVNPPSSLCTSSVFLVVLIVRAANFLELYGII